MCGYVVIEKSANRREAWYCTLEEMFWDWWKEFLAETHTWRLE